MIIEIKNAEVKRIKDVQTFDSGFQKQEVIVITDEKYPQELSIEFVKDNIAVSETLGEGDKVDIDVALNGREWEGHDRWFVSLKCINCDIQSTSEPVTKRAAKKKQEAINADADNSDVDSLPF